MKLENLKVWKLAEEKDYGKKAGYYLVVTEDSEHEITVPFKNEKDAALFAAAPKMLEALKHCLAYFKAVKPNYCGIADDRECSPYNEALQAIKKAKGEI